MKNILMTVTCLVAALFVGGLANVSAAPVSYAVNSSLSSLTLSGGVAGLPFMAQTPGSLTDAFTGTINADLTGGVLTFTGGSSITALLHPSAPFSTAPIVYPPFAVENYGVTASGIVPTFGGLTTINGVYHNMVLDVTAGTAQDGLAPGAMLIKYTSGRVDAGVASPVGGFPTGADLTTIAAASNTTPSLVSLPGAYTTLTLPVLFTTTGGSGRFETWTGTIVADMVVPEPAASMLVAFGAGLLLLNRRFFRS